MALFARRYNMQHVLGRGGNGIVWLAHDQNLDRDVAVKFFNPGIHPGIIFREAQLHVQLAGPHVLQVLDAAIVNDIPHVVTEVASGGSAMDRIAGTRGLPLNIAVVWIRHLLSGLAACHRQGLLHRDLKPGNLFLVADDKAQLGDFGLVDRMAGGTTAALGTPGSSQPNPSERGQ